MGKVASRWVPLLQADADGPPLCLRTMYLLGYIPKDDRLYLGDKELNIVSYSLLVSVLEYQTAVMRRDFGMADKVLPTIPKEQRTRVAHFLEKQVWRALTTSRHVTSPEATSRDQPVFRLPLAGLQTAGPGRVHGPRAPL